MNNSKNIVAKVKANKAAWYQNARKGNALGPVKPVKATREAREG